MLVFRNHDIGHGTTIMTGPSRIARAAPKASVLTTSKHSRRARLSDQLAAKKLARAERFRRIHRLDLEKVS